MFPYSYEGWTPKRVGAEIVAALKWVRRAGGPVGPTGIRSGQPAYLATAEEYFEDFGIPESADDPADLRPRMADPSPAQISRFLAALEWPTEYLHPDHVGSARMVALWAACKADRRSFSEAVEGRGVARHAAYALRDRGLSLISQGLTRDGILP